MDKRAHGGICIDIDQPPVRRVAHAGKDRGLSCARGSGNELKANAGGFAHPAQLRLIDQLGFKDAGRNRRCPPAAIADGLHQLQIDVGQRVANDGNGLGRGDAQALLPHRRDARIAKRLVELRAAAMHHDRGQPHRLKEGERGRERLHLFFHHRPPTLMTAKRS